MPRVAKVGEISKWSKWDRQHKIDVNNRCSNCGALIGYRRTKTGLCNHCATTANKAEKAPNWRGGRKVNAGGYIEIYYPEPHHRRQDQGGTYYVLEHILVWEKAHNKPLPDGYVIHHLNGIKTDNRPENLTAVKVKDHKRWTFVKALQSRIRELEQLRMPI
jgi:hypothetical protein